MIRRIWDLPLGAHALAFLVVAGLCLALTGPGAAFFSDEGAVVVQARLLESHDTWHYQPFSAVADPEQAARAFQHGDYGTEGLAPYAKHPLYPAATAELPGPPTTSALMVSIAGLIVAAVAAGLIAGDIEGSGRSLPRIALWSVGLASPLLFASGLVTAHTSAAAVAGLAVWASTALVSRCRAPSLRCAGLALVVMVACGLAAMLRSEALFLAPALVIGLLVSAPAERRARAGVAAGLAVLGAVVGTVVDRSWRSSIIGTGLTAPSDNPVPGTGSWVLDRLHGLFSTTVQAGYSLTRAQELVTWLAAVLLVGGAVAWRRRWVSLRSALLLGALAVVLYAVRLLVGPTSAIPGLLVACPLVGVAIVLLDRRVLTERSARFPLVVGVACLAAIVLTQYPNGGGLEWGWRYATFVLPVLLPPLLWGAWRVVEDRPEVEALRRPAVVLLLLAALLPTALSLRAQATSHDASREVADAMYAVAGQAALDGQRPVVLSWNRLLPQILYPVFDDYDWVVPDRASVATYVDRLSEAGVGRVMLVGPAADPVVEELEAMGWTVDERGPAAPYDVVVLSNNRS